MELEVLELQQKELKAALQLFQPYHQLVVVAVVEQVFQQEELVAMVVQLVVEAVGIIMVEMERVTLLQLVLLKVKMEVIPMLEMVVAEVELIVEVLQETQLIQV